MRKCYYGSDCVKMLCQERSDLVAKCLVFGFFTAVFVLNIDVDCKRFGGGGSRSWGGSRPSSRPSPVRRPSPSPPYWHPAPSSRPPPNPQSPSPSSGGYKPIGFENVKPVGTSPTHGAVGPPAHSPPNYGFNVGGISHGSSPPGIGFKPSVTQGHAGLSSQSHGSNPPPIGFKPSAPPAEHVSNSKPLGSTSSGHGTSGSSSGNPPPYGFKPSAPVGPPSNVKPVGNLPPGAPFPIHPPSYTPHNPGIPPPGYNPAHNPAGYGPPPAYNPTYNAAGYGHPPAYSSGYGYGSHPHQHYHPGGYGYPNQHYPGKAGATNVHITNINNNNHHYGGGGGYGYGGGFGGGFGGYSYPSYHYSSGNVGSGALGFFLGYSLAKMTTPTFHYNSGFYDGYTPRYDHYEVHHYYHNRESIPAQSTIQPNTIVGCVGDSGTICPSGTTSLCTSNGAILCVASARSTVPCSDHTQGNCVRTIVPCVNGTGDCQVGQNTTLSIPCISKALVPGNITYINNTIIVNQTTIINNNNVNISTSSNSTTLSSTSSTIANSTNLTDDALKLLSNSSSSTTEVSTTTPLNMTSDGSRKRREAPAVPVNDFCVTILALPAERKPTEQEQLVEKGAGILAKFLVRALGINNV